MKVFARFLVGIILRNEKCKKFWTYLEIYNNCKKDYGAQVQLLKDIIFVGTNTRNKLSFVSEFIVGYKSTKKRTKDG